jgi:outer membrane protein assembly factor BamD
MRWLRSAGCTAVVFLTLVGCGSTNEVVTLTAEKHFERAKAMFDDHDYLDALNEFTVITLQYQGSTVAADAQYYIGECRFMKEEYLIAAVEYAMLKRNYPASPRVADAQFKTGLSYYHWSPKASLDQTFTRKAIDEFQTFVEYYPKHPSVPEAEEKIRELTSRLAKKHFEDAELYATMQYYKAALLYFDSVIEKYHDTEYAPLAYIRKAEILYDRKKYGDANETLKKFIALYPNSPLLKRAADLKEKVEEALRTAPSGNTTPSAEKRPAGDPAAQKGS